LRLAWYRLVGNPQYMQNPLRQDLWRAGHAHTGVLLVLSILVLRYVDEAHLSERLKRFVRYAIPSATILLPPAFFLSVLSPDATEPNALIYLTYLGGLLLASALVTLGVGVLRSRARVWILSTVTEVGPHRSFEIFSTHCHSDNRHSTYA
jgi:hypothetical protein